MFEYDVEGNVGGYGFSMGLVTDAETVKPWVRWCDGQNNGYCAKCYLRVAPDIGETVTSPDGAQYKVKDYDKSGAVVKLLTGETCEGQEKGPKTRAALKKKPKDSPFVKPASPAVNKPASPAVNKQTRSRSKTKPKKKQSKKKETTDPKAKTKKTPAPATAQSSADKPQNKPTSPAVNKQTRSRSKTTPRAKKKPRRENHPRAKSKRKGADTLPAEESVYTSSTPWVRSRAPALSDEENCRLPAAIKACKINLDTCGRGYYTFLHRVCKEYKSYMEDPTMKVDKLHAHRDSIVAACIGQVFTEVRPANQVPHLGHTTTALVHILPVVEKVFQMPAAGCPYGSPEWEKEVGKDMEKLPFSVAARHKGLLAKLVRYYIKNGDPTAQGFPIREEGKYFP